MFGEMRLIVMFKYEKIVQSYQTIGATCFNIGKGRISI